MLFVVLFYMAGGVASEEAKGYSAVALLAASPKGVLAEQLGEVLVDQGADDEVALVCSSLRRA
jgi:hypothetical protein